MKYVVIILDGAAGWPLPELGSRTTLQAAELPNLDRLAAEGTVGLAQTVPDGMEPSSAAACMSIIGYDPIANHVGRGAIEAASMGIELADDEVALRLNLVTIEQDKMRSYSAGHISTEEAGAIVTDMAATLDNETFTLYPGIAYRHILVVKGHPELMDGKYTPPHDITDRSAAEHLPTGPGALLLLEYMEMALPILENSGVNRCRADEGGMPVTHVWPFWPGMAPKGMVPFEELHGARAAMTSGVDLLNGMAVLAGIDRLEIAGVSDGPDNDYVAQIEGALAALDDHDVVVVHVESPDEAGHSGDLEAKVAAVEAIDREMVSRVLDHPQEIRVLAMPDHPTPIALRTHVGEAVPFVIWGPGVPANGAESYDEGQASGTGLVLDPGYGVMDLLLTGGGPGPPFRV